MSTHDVETASSLRTGWLRHLLDRLFGYDYFISYAHADGTEYPLALRDRLEEAGFRAFFDTSEGGHNPGDDLRAATHRRVRMSTYIVLVARPHALRSDWVLKELEAYLGSGRVPIVVNVNRALESSDADPKILDILRDRIFISEKLEAGASQPSDSVLKEFRRSFMGHRQETRRLRFLATASAVFAALAIVATALAITASVEAGIANAETAKEKEATARALVKAFEAAMKGGGWEAALHGIDEALKAGQSPSESVRLRLERVKALSALYRIPEAEKELQELAGRPDLETYPEGKGLVLLWQGDLNLSHSFRQSETSLDMIRRASRLKLPDPELAYAEGLLAETSEEAVSHLEEAVKSEPFHPRANAILAMFYIHMGRLEEARERVAFGEKVFPRDPAFMAMRASIFALEDNMPAADAVVKRMEQLTEDRSPAGEVRLSKGRVESVRKYLTVYNGVRRLDVAGWLDPNAPKFGQYLSGLKLIGLGASLLGRPATEEVEFFPLPPIILSGFTRLFALMPRVKDRIVSGGDIDAELKELSALNRMRPDGFFHLLSGMLLGKNDRWAEAEDAFRSAVKTPSIFNLREPALYLAATAGIIRSRDTADPAEKSTSLSRVHGAVEEIIKIGEFHPDQAERFLEFFMEINEYKQARYFLDQWERRSPGDPSMLRLRAAYELGTGAYGEAVKTADLILKRRPDDQGAKKIRASAVERLRELIKAVDSQAPAAREE